MLDAHDEQTHLEPDCKLNGHTWEHKYRVDCNTCSYRAGPGDWGMCMPDTGVDVACVNSGDPYDQCRNCGAIRLWDGMIVPSDWFETH